MIRITQTFEIKGAKFGSGVDTNKEEDLTGEIWRMIGEAFEESRKEVQEYITEHGIEKAKEHFGAK